MKRLEHSTGRRLTWDQQKAEASEIAKGYSISVIN